jgi:hypothetical protein
MADNGTGTFVRLYNWVVDKTNSVPITATKMDAEMDGMATALSNRIAKDGQTTVTADIPFNSHKLTGLAVGTARTDAITLGQVQDGQFTYLGTTGGIADAYTATPSPAITAYAVTQRFSAKISATNLTTTPYLQISAIGTPASDAVIKKLSVTKTEIAVEVSDMVANGIYQFQRNSANTAWILLNPEKRVNIIVNSLATPSQGTLTISGGVITVTGSNHLIDTESAAATDDLDTINGGSEGQILAIGSVSASRNIVIKHNTGNIYNPNQLDIILDLTTDRVWLQYSLALLKWIVTSNSTLQDYVSSAQTITASGQTVLAHGLGAQPKSVSLWLENVTASIGYTTGQQVLINPAMNDSSDTTRSRAFSVIADATNITVRTPTDTGIIICNASSGAFGAIVAASWKFVIKAKK